MNAFPGSLPALFVLLAGPALASVLEVGTIEQPVNLGANADPSRIPLGPVVIETNHGYGRHPIISAPRPCTHGTLAVEKGLELNMNLASVFGIEVIPEDSTDVPRAPVTIRIKDWPVPAYSPYRKDQVVSATLHCLLRSVHASPESPLKIRIDAENREDAKNLKGFAGEYLTAEAEKQGGPTPVPGSHTTTDGRGVTYVVFAEAGPPSPEALKRPPPAVIPSRLESEEPETLYKLIPVWAGDDWTQPAQVLTQPVTLFHDLFDPSITTGPDINEATRRKIYQGCAWSEHFGDSRFTVRAEYRPENAPSDLLDSVCALFHAAVITALPTTQRPLTVNFHTEHALLKAMAPFVNGEGWKQRDLGHGNVLLSCKLVWDPGNRKLTKGSIPRGTLAPSSTGTWMVSFVPKDFGAGNAREDRANLPEARKD